MAGQAFGKAFERHQQGPDARPLMVTLNLAGEDVNFYEPTGGQVMAMTLMGSSTSSQGVMEMTRDVAQLLMGMSDEAGVDHMKAALVHWSQPLPLEALIGVVKTLTESFAARPTESPSDSLEPPPSTGKSSTANSRRAVSKVSST